VVFCFTVYYPNQIFLLFFHCTSTFPFSPSIAQFYSSRLSCTFCLWARNFSIFLLVYLFWNFITFFNLVRIFATSNLWSELQPAARTVRTSLYCFWTDVSQLRSPAGVVIDLLVVAGVKSSLGFLQPYVGDVEFIPLTNVDDGFASVLSLFQFIWSNSFPVHMVQLFFYMIYLQPVCSIPPLWQCLSHLFNLLQELLQLYRKFLLSVIFNPRCRHVHHK